MFFLRGPVPVSNSTKECLPEYSSAQSCQRRIKDRPEDTSGAHGHGLGRSPHPAVQLEAEFGFHPLRHRIGSELGDFLEILGKGPFLRTGLQSRRVS